MEAVMPVTFYNCHPPFGPGSQCFNIICTWRGFCGPLPHTLRAPHLQQLLSRCWAKYLENSLNQLLQCLFTFTNKVKLDSVSMLFVCRFEEPFIISFLGFMQVFLDLLCAATRGSRTPLGAQSRIQWPKSQGLIQGSEVFSITWNTTEWVVAASPWHPRAAQGLHTSPTCRWVCFYPCCRLALFPLVLTEVLTLNFKASTNRAEGYTWSHFPD